MIMSPPTTRSRSNMRRSRSYEDVERASHSGDNSLRSTNNEPTSRGRSTHTPAHDVEMLDGRQMNSPMSNRHSDAMTCKIKPECFNGDGGWNDYQSSFEAIARINRWNENAKANFLFAHLRGSARQLACNLPTAQQLDYVYLCNALESRFGPSKRAELHMAELRTRHKRRGESLRELGQAIATTAKLAYPDLTLEQRDRLCRNHFIEALPEKDMRVLMYQKECNSLDRLITYAMELESIESMETERNRETTKSNIRQVSAPQPVEEMMSQIQHQIANLNTKVTEMAWDRRQSQPGGQRRRVAEVRCYECHEIGHFRNRCPRLGRQLTPRDTYHQGN